MKDSVEEEFYFFRLCRREFEGIVQIVLLEKQGKIKGVSQRTREFTYPDGCEIMFV